MSPPRGTYALRYRVYLLAGRPKWFRDPDHAKTFLLAQRQAHPDSDGCLWVEQGTHDTLLGYVDSEGRWVQGITPRGPGRPKKAGLRGRGYHHPPPFTGTPP